MAINAIFDISVLLNFTILLRLPRTVVWVWLKNIFELYSCRLTPFVLVVKLDLARLILSPRVGVDRKSDFKENTKSNLDLNLGFLGGHHLYW